MWQLPNRLYSTRPVSFKKHRLFTIRKSLLWWNHQSLVCFWWNPTHTDFILILPTCRHSDFSQIVRKSTPLSSWTLSSDEVITNPTGGETKCIPHSHLMLYSKPALGDNMDQKLTIHCFMTLERSWENRQSGPRLHSPRRKSKQIPCSLLLYFTMAS